MKLHNALNNYHRALGYKRLAERLAYDYLVANLRTDDAKALERSARIKDRWEGADIEYKRLLRKSERECFALTRMTVGSLLTFHGNILKIRLKTEREKADRKGIKLPILFL